MARVAIFVGNPLRDSFSEAIGEAYRLGAESGGHEVKLFRLGQMNFDPILHEGYRREQALEPDLAAARAAFAACDHMVFVFPLWCGDMPALMKGFFERVLQPDLLKFETSGGRDKVTLYRGKSARIIMTMGMPGWFYRWYFGAYALKLITRNILKFIGIKPVRSTVYGMVETVSVDTRRQWLREVEALGHMAS